jgi:low affinity Fe/Cu permease
MAYRSSNFADILVNQKGSGTQAIVGIIILVIGVGVGQVLKNDLVTYISIAIGVAIIISSFLIIINNTQTRKIPKTSWSRHSEEDTICG